MKRRGRCEDVNSLSEGTSIRWLKFNELEAEVFGSGAEFGQSFGATLGTVFCRR